MLAENRGIIREKVMLHLPNNGHRVYEVAIYNEAVREKVKHKERHAYFDDRWARPQLRNVVARDETEARALIAERFPPEDGFVIKVVHPSRF